MFNKNIKQTLLMLTIIFMSVGALCAQYTINISCFGTAHKHVPSVGDTLYSTIGQCMNGISKGSGYTLHCGFRKVSLHVTDIMRDPHIMPGQFELLQNYPNPFNPLTTIKFNLPKAMQIRVVVYDILGRHVHTLTEGFKPAGAYMVTFDASHLASGVYLYSIRSKEFNAVRKMVVTK